MTTHRVTNATWTQVLKYDAQPGDVIECAEFIGFAVETTRALRTVTKKTGFRFVGFDGVGVVFNDCHDMLLEAPRVRADNTSGGIRFAGGANLRVHRADIDGAANGISFNRIDGFEVLDCVIKGVGGDAVRWGESRNGWIARNRASDFRRISISVHPDGFQGWSRATSLPSSNVVVEDNVVIGDAQGIGCFNHARVYEAGKTIWDRTLGAFRVLEVDELIDDGGCENYVIRRNRIEGGLSWGICLADSRNCVVQDNHVSTLPGAASWARIGFPGATNLTLGGNLAEAYTTPAGRTYPEYRDAPLDAEDPTPTEPPTPPPPPIDWRAEAARLEAELAAAGADMSAASAALQTATSDLRSDRDAMTAALNLAVANRTSRKVGWVDQQIAILRAALASNPAGV
jgi:parallel beta-helix repeat protein